MDGESVTHVNLISTRYTPEMQLFEFNTSAVVKHHEPIPRSLVRNT